MGKFVFGKLHIDDGATTCPKILQHLTRRNQELTIILGFVNTYQLSHSCPENEHIKPSGQVVIITDLKNSQYDLGLWYTLFHWMIIIHASEFWFLTYNRAAEAF